MAGRRRTRSARFAPALAVVATLAAVVAATAGALAFDDQRPCPAAYTENEKRSATPSGALRVPGRHRGNAVRGPLSSAAEVASPTSDSPSSSGALPPGTSFSAGGLLSGTPARSRSWRFWVRAQDARAPDRRTRLVHLRGSGRRRVRDHRPPGGRRHDGGRRAGTVGAPYDLSLSAQTTSEAEPALAAAGLRSG